MNDEVKNKLNEYSTDNLGDFMSNYRTALEDQRTADMNALENQRNLAYTGIMTGANRRGLLHSNFPTRDKLRYDVETYEPARVKIQQSYQTGLDTLYNNAAKYLNQIKKYREQTADINDYANSLTSGGSGGGTGGGYYPSTGNNNSNQPTSTGANVNYTQEQGYQFTDDQGNPITFYEWAQRKNDPTYTTNYLKEMANKGDANAKHAIAGLLNTDRGADQLGNLTAEEIAAMKTLGWTDEALSKFGTRN